MHFLITAAGTREYIDPVRFISNASTGKMGYALALAAIKAGHKVTLISASAALRPPTDCQTASVEDETGQCNRRCSRGPGRLYRNVPAHYSP